MVLFMNSRILIIIALVEISFDLLVVYNRNARPGYSVVNYPLFIYFFGILSLIQNNVFVFLPNLNYKIMHFFDLLLLILIHISNGFLIYWLLGYSKKSPPK